MANSGEYREKLPCGGTLIVDSKSFSIEYYFSGPDMRYNGTWVRVPGHKLEDYINAFTENFQEYERLRTTMPGDGEFAKKGLLGMYIRVGSYWDGVCIESIHMPISSQKQLSKVVDSYLYAEERAKRIMPFLKTL